MKKAITILAILIVLVSAVFAEAPAGISNQRLTIKSVVDRRDPSFRLVSGDVSSVNVDAASPAGTHNGELVESGKDISAEDVTVTFGIKQTTDAKNNYTYTFNVTASTFKGLETEYETVGTITYGAGTVGSGLTAYVAATENTQASGNQGIYSIVNQAEANTDGFQYIIRYSGTAVVNANSTLVTFPITWGRDIVAETDNYLADVTMTIGIQ